MYAPDRRGKMQEMHPLLAVAQVVKRPYSRIYNDMTCGRLKAERIEGRWFVTATELARYSRDLDRMASIA